MIPDPEDPTKWFIGNATDPVLGAQVGSALLVNVHLPDKCNGEWCVVHNPSPHHMRGWRLNWRDDTGIMERLCPHGVGHPDPDSVAFHERIGQSWAGSHGCDGCCQKPD